MTREKIEEAKSLLTQVHKILVNSNSWLENTHEPLNMAFDMAIKALEREDCEDAISRQQVQSEYADWYGYGYQDNWFYKRIKDLPPVNSTKTGKWILIDKELSRYKCSECGEIIKLHKKSEISKLEKDETLSNYPFSHCGARMIEAQERGDKE